MAEIFKLGTIKCPECGETDRIELIDKKEVEEETRGVGFNTIRVVPIFNYFFRCKKCGELFLVQINPDKAGKV